MNDLFLRKLASSEAAGEIVFGEVGRVSSFCSVEGSNIISIDGGILRHFVNVWERQLRCRSLGQVVGPLVTTSVQWILFTFWFFLFRFFLFFLNRLFYFRFFRWKLYVNVSDLIVLIELDKLVGFGSVLRVFKGVVYSELLLGTGVYKVGLYRILIWPDIRLNSKYRIFV